MGFEICTAPANGDLFTQQIEDICHALQEQDAEVSSECGYHVHIDARDLGYWDLRKLILLYAKVEDALFSVVPKSRRSSNYCRPCGQKYAEGLEQSWDAKRAVIDKVYPTLKEYEGKARGERLQSLKGDKYASVRYHALNLHSWFYRGTVECRLAAGTTKADKVVNWALLWAGILDYALQHSETHIRKLDGDSWAVLLQVCPSDDIRQWLIGRRDKFGS